MIDCDEFYQALLAEGVDYFSGVPDSLLKDICACITHEAAPTRHMIAANEGGALALAIGYHLATEKFPLVYLQNSGLGNLVNPLTSLADPEVYSIPVLLLVGWRGEPGYTDEPQHRKQGRITLELLNTLEVPWAILPQDMVGTKKVLAEAVATARERSGPYAIVVRKGTFRSYDKKNKTTNCWSLRREQALNLILDQLDQNEIVVTTTGMASREVFEHRAKRSSGHARDFLTVGGMGHASQIALGIAGQSGARQVWCLDGDGAVLMHMGALAIAGSSDSPNFRHVVLNNGAHDSVGGQQTAGFEIQLAAVAAACGYGWTRCVSAPSDLIQALQEMRAFEGKRPAFLEVRINRGARPDLGRPTTTTRNNKREFMAYVRG